MAIVEVKVPQLSESVAEGVLLKWKKNVGDSVAQDEILIEIETDKVVLEVPAPTPGVLSECIAQEGAVVQSEAVIARIDTSVINSLAVAKQESEKVNPILPPEAVIHASVVLPSAAKLMAEKNLSPDVVSGTGRGGRITKSDILHAQFSNPTEKAAIKVEKIEIPLINRLEQRVPMSRLRARIAERLLESQRATATLSTFNEVDMSAVIAVRNQYKEVFEKKYGVKLGFMSFFVKAAIYALKKFPILNASVDEGYFTVFHQYFDIGVAIGAPRGLVVPILRNADQLSFSDMEKAIADFGARAKTGKLTQEELSGGTFSLSNGGTFGSMLSTPIINPPQSAILGIHATKERAVVYNGQIVIRPMNYLALSYDHRIIDGREAVLGLVAIKEALEDPMRLLLDL